MPSNDELLGQWYALKKKLDEYKVVTGPLERQELELRRLLMSRIWGDPKEGTNKAQMPGGWMLKGVQKINRDVDEAALQNYAPQMREIGLNPDELFCKVPELNLKAYRELTDDQRKFVDQVLNIKPAAPTLELIPPASK